MKLTETIETIETVGGGSYYKITTLEGEQPYGAMVAKSPKGLQPGTQITFEHNTKQNGEYVNHYANNIEVATNGTPPPDPDTPKSPSRDEKTQASIEAQVALREANLKGGTFEEVVQIAGEYYKWLVSVRPKEFDKLPF